MARAPNIKKLEHDFEEWFKQIQPLVNGDQTSCSKDQVIHIAEVKMKVQKLKEVQEQNMMDLLKKEKTEKEKIKERLDKLLVQGKNADVSWNVQSSVQDEAKFWRKKRTQLVGKLTCTSSDSGQSSNQLSEKDSKELMEILKRSYEFLKDTFQKMDVNVKKSMNMCKDSERGDLEDCKKDFNGMRDDLAYCLLPMLYDKSKDLCGATILQSTEKENYFIACLRLSWVMIRHDEGPYVFEWCSNSDPTKELFAKDSGALLDQNFVVRNKGRLRITAPAIVKIDPKSLVSQVIVKGRVQGGVGSDVSGEDIKVTVH